MQRIVLGLFIFAACYVPQIHAEDQVFFGNLHSHTSYSDGSGTPSQAYKWARDTAKLNFLAITEHNHRLAESGASADRKDDVLIAKDPTLYTGPKSSALIPTASRYTKTNQFVALYGQEFSSISAGRSRRPHFRKATLLRQRHSSALTVI